MSELSKTVSCPRSNLRTTVFWCTLPGYRTCRTLWLRKIRCPSGSTGSSSATLEDRQNHPVTDTGKEPWLKNTWQRYTAEILINVRIIGGYPTRVFSSLRESGTQHAVVDQVFCALEFKRFFTVRVVHDGQLNFHQRRDGREVTVCDDTFSLLGIN